MGTLTRTVLALLIGPLLYGATFRTGQAARAVIGQSSFSSRDAGIQASALSVGDGKLFVADISQHLLTFDLSQIPGAKDDAATLTAACAVCGFNPVTSAEQSVMPGIAAVATWGKALVVADPVNHRVLIWRDTARMGSETAPDVTLGPAAFASPSTTASVLAMPVSVAFDGQRLFVGDGGLHRVLVWSGLPSSDDQPPQAVLGQPSLPSALDSDRPGADTVGTPEALASDGKDLFVADSLNRRILIFSPGDVALAGNQVINPATLQPGPLAAGSLVSVIGEGLTEQTASSSDEEQALPRRLAGVQLLVDGSAIPLETASPSEVRAQIPFDLSTGSASLYLRVEHPDGSVSVTNAVPLHLVTAAPGLFAFGGHEPRNGMALHGGETDGKGSPITEADPARPGEVVTVWATGLGPVQENPESPVSAGVPLAGEEAPAITPVSASIDGRPAEVLSAALPKGSVGIYEIRIRLPRDLVTHKTALFISQAGLNSNTVLVASRGGIQ